jgi:hypothetical protein
MLFLLGCVGEADKPASDRTEPSADTAVDTGDTDDTGSGNEPCAQPGAVHTLPTGGTVFSPYGTLITVDLDGGGRADVLHETFDPVRGVALLRGEDAAFGGVTPVATFPATLLAQQAGLVVGVGGDLNADGAREILVGQGEEGGARQLDVWSLGETTTPLASVTFSDAPQWGIAAPSEETGPDLDGDGVAEVLVTALGGQYLYGSVYVFSGAALGGGASLDEGDALASFGDDDSAWASNVVVAPDLDGDGVAELLLNHLDYTHGGDVRVVPSGLGGGTFSPDDLDVLLALPDESRAPLFLDIDADGVPEVFAAEGDSNGSVRGFAGEVVAASARDGATLTADDAWVEVLGGRDDYFGMHLAPVTDADCAVGLAVSAHFAGEVRLIANADLIAGGTVASVGSPTLTGTADWFGYVLAGGQDLDLDGTLDLVVAGRDGGDMVLYLSPADAAGE